MTPNLLIDASLGFLIGAGIGVPVFLQSPPTVDWSLMRDLAGAGGVGAVIAVVWMNQKDRKEEREKASEERQRGAEMLARERDKAAEERQHGFDRVAEITTTFSKTVLELTQRKQ